MEETLGHPTPIGQSQAAHDNTLARTFSCMVSCIFSDGISSPFFSSLHYSLFWVGQERLPLCFTLLVLVTPLFILPPS